MVDTCDPEFCPFCIPPSGYAESPDAGVFPETWHCLSEHPTLKPGRWAEGLMYCHHCGTIWWLRYDPRDLAYTDAVPLPPWFESVLRADAKFDEILRVLDATSWGEHAKGKEGILEDLIDGYVQGGYYSASHALNRLVSELERPGLVAVQVDRWLRILALIAGLYNPHHYRIMQDRNFQTPLAELEDPGPLLRLLDREDLYTGSEGERDRARAGVKRTFSAFIDNAFSGPKGRRADTVRVPPNVRQRLCELAGKRDPTTATPGARPRVRKGIETQQEIREGTSSLQGQQGTGVGRGTLEKTDSPRSLPAGSFSSSLSNAISRLRNGYLFFAPGIVVTWFMAEVVPKGVPPSSRTIVAGLLLLVNLVWYAAAASKAAGRWEKNLFALVVQRISVGITYVAAFLVWGLTLVPVYGMVLGIFGPNHERVMNAMEPVAAGVGVVLLFRLWPVLSVPFLYGGYSRLSLAATAQVWMGPGLCTAWTMTEGWKVLWRLSMPTLTLTAVLLGVHRILLNLAAGSVILRFVAHIFLYGVALPFVATVVDAGAERIRIPTRYDARIET